MAELAEARAALLLEAWRDDPRLFALDLLGVTLYPWQERVLEVFHAGARRVAVKAPRGSGKTTTASVLAWWMLCNHPDTLTAVITPVARQARHGLMSEMRRIWDASPKLRALFPGFEVLDLEIRTPRPAWRVVAWSAGDDLDALEGLHGPEGVLLVVDEAKAVADEVWTRLQPMLRGPESRVLAVSTPGGRSGFFWEAFTNGTREVFDETVSVSLEDCPHLQELAAREAKRLGSETALYQRQFEAEFAEADESPLFPISLLEASRCDPDGPDDEGIPWIARGEPRRRFGGFDPAGLGANDSVMALVVGRCVKEIRVLPKLEPMALAAEAVVQARQWGLTSLAVDATGLGGPLASRMQDLAPERLSIVKYIAGGKPFEASGANTKSSVAMRLREQLLENAIGFDLPDADFNRLARELAGMCMVTEFRTGRVRIQDPSRSPDFADAVLAALSGYLRPPSVVSFSEAHLWRNVRRARGWIC